jgi:hypothetical protein
MPIDPIPQIAQRYHVPEAKVRELYQQLQKTGGRQCQFNCDELGGPVQWMPGMITVSRWNDHQLRARVDGLCSELAAIVQGSDTAAPAALMREPGTAPAGACVGLAAGESWWPASLGHPSTSGEQNGMRYAYFPEKKRLLIQEGAHLQAYDTGGHYLTGVAQQQGHTRNLTFSSLEGPVDLKHLTCLPHLGE